MKATTTTLPREDRNIIETYLHRCLSDVHDVTGVRPSEIMSKRRGYEYITHARFMVYAMMRGHDLEPPLTQIGSLMGRDHGSVLNGIKKLRGHCEYNKKLRRRVEMLRERGHNL